MRFRPLFPPALLLSALALPASAQTVFEVVSGGEVQLQGGEQVCFRFDRAPADEVTVTVSLRFTSWVPRGYLELNGLAGPDFGLPAEDFEFRVDPRGVHRLRLRLEESATVDRLLITVNGLAVEQASCKDYEGSRRVPIEAAPEPVNRLGEPETEPEAPVRPPAPPVVDAPPAAEAPPAPAPSSPGALRAATGTELQLLLDREISTSTAYAGQAFTTRLARPLLVGGEELLPEGTTVRGRVAESKDAGRFGRSTLRLSFDRAILEDGTELELRGSVRQVGKGSAKKQGGIIAGSALGGAILGEMLGGDAALGALLGGAIAAGSIAAEPGESVVLPAGTVLTVGLDAPLERPAPS